MKRNWKKREWCIGTLRNGVVKTNTIMVKCIDKHGLWRKERSVCGEKYLEGSDRD